MFELTRMENGPERPPHSHNSSQIRHIARSQNLLCTSTDLIFTGILARIEGYRNGTRRVWCVCVCVCGSKREKEAIVHSEVNFFPCA
jgi:hypothetical protein